MRLGLVGGLGTAAGVFYYRRLVAALEKRGERPDLLLAHADVRRVFAYQRGGDFDALATYLTEILESLAKAGCTVAAISAVSPHVCIPQLRERSPTAIIDMLQAVRAALDASTYRRIALFGTKRVMESDLFGALPHLDVVRPAQRDIDEVDRIYTALVARGTATPEERDALNRLGADLVRSKRVDAIVFAGTDLSAVFEGHQFDFPVLDAAEAHIVAIVDYMAAEK